MHLGVALCIVSGVRLMFIYTYADIFPRHGLANCNCLDNGMPRDISN